MTRNGDYSLPIGHDDVLPLARDAEANLLQHPNGIEVIDAGDLRHRSDDLDFPNVRVLEEFVADREVIADGVLNVRKRFSLGSAL